MPPSQAASDPDARPRRTVPLPRFRQPAAPEPTQEDPLILTREAMGEELGDQPAPWSHSEPAVLRDVAIPKPARSATHTDTSATSNDDVDPKVIVGLVIALVGLGVTAAAVMVKRARPGRRLRRPTDKQVKDFSAPLSRILLRHVEIARLHPSLADGIAAAGAVGAYIEEDRLTVAARPDSGVPAGINQEEDD